MTDKIINALLLTGFLGVVVPMLIFIYSKMAVYGALVGKDLFHKQKKSNEQNPT